MASPYAGQSIILTAESFVLINLELSLLWIKNEVIALYALHATMQVGKPSSSYKISEQQNLRQWEDLIYMCEL